MKRLKPAFKIISLTLSLFFLITGSSQALPRLECQSTCCRKTPPKLTSGKLIHAASVHHRTPFERVFAFYDPFNDGNTLRDMLPEKHTCHDDIFPVCCNAEDASRQVIGLASTSSTRTDRLSAVGISLPLEHLGTSRQPHSPSHTRPSLPARAAPPPLYIQFSALLI